MYNLSFRDSLKAFSATPEKDLSEFDTKYQVLHKDVINKMTEEQALKCRIKDLEKEIVNLQKDNYRLLCQLSKAKSKLPLYIWFIVALAIINSLYQLLL